MRDAQQNAIMEVVEGAENLVNQIDQIEVANGFLQRSGKYTGPDFDKQLVSLKKAIRWHNELKVFDTMLVDETGK